MHILEINLKKNTVSLSLAAQNYEVGVTLITDVWGFKVWGC